MLACTPTNPNHTPGKKLEVMEGFTNYYQGSRLCTIPTSMADIYCTGKQTGTYEPLVSYRKKYWPYRSHTGRTGEIRLFRPVNGYRTGTFSHAALNFCLSLPPLYHTGDDEIPIGGEERRR